MNASPDPSADTLIGPSEVWPLSSPVESDIYVIAPVASGVHVSKSVDVGASWSIWKMTSTYNLCYHPTWKHKNIMASNEQTDHTSRSDFRSFIALPDTVPLALTAVTYASIEMLPAPSPVA